MVKVKDNSGNKKLAKIISRVIDEKTKTILVTKDDLKRFATKDDLKQLSARQDSKFLTRNQFQN